MLWKVTFQVATRSDAIAAKNGCVSKLLARYSIVETRCFIQLVPVCGWPTRWRFSVPARDPLGGTAHATRSTASPYSPPVCC